VSLSKRLRFEVFKRDGFRCCYCGATAQDRPLHVDHVVAVANGGTDDEANLVTACDACNLGKSDVPLNRQRLGGPMDTEHLEQIRAYLDLQREIGEQREAMVETALQHWETHLVVSNHWCPRVQSALRSALREFRLDEVFEASDIVAANVGGRYTGESHVRYFYGVLRNWRSRRRG